MERKKNDVNPSDTICECCMTPKCCHAAITQHTIHITQVLLYYWPYAVNNFLFTLPHLIMILNLT